MPQLGNARRFRCDLTWLTSNWTCTFGDGCCGIDASKHDLGCCVLGAHFTDKDDLTRVKAIVDELGEDEWELHPGSTRRSAWTEKEEGDLKTKVVDGACIFLNRPGFPAGAGPDRVAATDCQSQSMLAITASRIG